MKMEKPIRGRSPKKLKSTTNYLCMPRLRNNSCPNKTKGLTPMTLLERFREAVFRLIMFSAFSNNKATDHVGPTEARRYYRPDNDHLHSEAVADCIEFIKKKSLPEDQNNRDSSASSSLDSTAEGVIAMPVIM